jgi:prepilin-type processing-associated H-X9-DG protein
VVGVIAVLAALLLPVLAAARRAAKRTECAAHLHAVGHAVMMYANDNRSYVPFAAHSAAANIIQHVNPLVLPLEAYQIHSGLLVHRYLNRIVRTIFCPATEEKWVPEQKRFLQTAPPSQAWTNYIQRNVGYDLDPKLRRGRQSVMQDWYWVPDNPLMTTLTNHEGGANCLYTDGSVLWHRLPRAWVHNTHESWDQLDRGAFEPRR